MTRVVILGGGPAGLGAAWRLHATGRAEAVLLERAPFVGGNAGSFEWAGHRVDFGSHRLHPACDPEVLDDIRGLLGEELLDRPRHGRIRLLGRWVHFPLKPVDMLLHVHPAFAAGAMFDMVRKALPFRKRPEEENFETVLWGSLGPTICRHFYMPYARKLWGRDPTELSAIQARRRVSASSFGKLFRKVLGQVPGLKPPFAGRFFYPRRGFGQVSEGYEAAARKDGADVRLGHTVTRIERTDGPGGTFTVHADSGDGEVSFEADYVWSTIPVTLLLRMLRPEPPEEILAATEGISYRAMVLVYLELDTDQFTEYDAHYFPGEDVTITRLSEPKNYAARTKPEGTTVICAEIPCDVGDEVWSRSDEELGELLAGDLERSGLPIPGKPISVGARRLPQAYPIYLTGYEEPFGVMDDYLETVDGLLSYGRQGLFAHDNTHHALAMAYAAVDCLADGAFDTAKWAEYRERFKSHVVED